MFYYCEISSRRSNDTYTCIPKSIQSDRLISSAKHLAMERQDPTFMTPPYSTTQSRGINFSKSLDLG